MNLHRVMQAIGCARPQGQPRAVRFDRELFPMKAARHVQFESEEALAVAIAVESGHGALQAGIEMFQQFFQRLTKPLRILPG